MKKKIFVAAITFLLLIGLAYAWTPPGDIDLRNYYSLFGALWVNSTNFSASGYFIGNGSQLTDVVASTTNYSSYANLSYYTWYVDNSTERSLFTTTFNSTYDDYITANVSAEADTLDGYDSDFFRPLNKSDVYIGTSDADHYIYFYEDGSPTGESLKWDDAGDKFVFSDRLETIDGIQSGSTIYAVSRIYTAGDIYTTGPGDDLWLGSSTQGTSSFQANADGSLNISSGEFQINTTGSITEVKSIHFDDNEKIILGTDSDVEMYFNGTHLIIQKT